MADTTGMADNRSIDIDKMVKGFAEIENVFKRYVTVQPCSAREIRWFQKTAGFLDSTDTTTTTTSQIKSVAGAQPHIIEPSWTRNTSYAQKYIAESPKINIEDLKDNDVQIWSTVIRDLTRAVQRQVDKRIYDVITENQSPSLINSTAAGATWDNGTQSNVTIVKDILTAKQKIYSQGYNPEGAILAMNPIEFRLMLTNLIETKGSSIPQFSSEKIRSGSVVELLGVQVVVSENATTDSVAMWVPDRAATWKSFVPISNAIIDDPGIGKIFRVWEEGECLLTDPKAVHLTTNTIT